MTVTPLLEPLEIQTEELEQARKLMRCIEEDSTAENAYVHLLSAWQLQSTPGSKPLQRSILQHFVLCIEAIVNGTMAKIKIGCADKIRKEEREFSNQFSIDLPNRADKASAIREASTRLREISFANTLPAISQVAKS